MLSFDIATLRAAYAAGSLTPTQLVEEILRRTAEDPNKVWIHRLPEAALRQYAAALEGKDPRRACRSTASPSPSRTTSTSPACRPRPAAPPTPTRPSRAPSSCNKLIEAGAIPVGKTNLDQFATGLNGTRSPYGACRNAFDPAYVSGGSSSGSAVAVAKGYASFSLGTDTAGSGRVPAAFNNLVGHKPSCGWLSTTGVVPACRSLDAVSIFALNAADAEAVLAVAASFDADRSLRPRRRRPRLRLRPRPSFKFGVPRAADLQFFGDAESERIFRDVGGAAAVARRRGGRDRPRALPRHGQAALRRALGGRALPGDPRLLRRAARGAVPGDARDHGERQEVFGRRRLRLPLQAQGRQARMRCRVGGRRLHRHADRADDLHHRADGSRPDQAQLQPRLLHQLHEPARLRGDRRAGRIPQGWTAAGRDAVRPGRAGRAAAAPVGEAARRAAARRRWARRATPLAVSPAPTFPGLPSCPPARSASPSAARTSRACRSTGSSPRAAAASSPPPPPRPTTSSTPCPAARRCGPAWCGFRRWRGDRSRGVGTAGARIRLLRRRHPRAAGHRHHRPG